MNEGIKAWYKECIVYQIYPMSFCDSNGDGIGDLPGIISKLDYIKDLGADVIWLSPCYQSSNKDNGYDISDYYKIAQQYGTMDDFDELLRKAHDKGLKIVMDLVVNHTSDEHAWFTESRKSRDNPYRDYYIWKDGKGGGAPNNWGSLFGGSAWEYDEKTDMYYLHIFSTKQPDLNWENEKVRNEVYKMMRWWLDKGIDGFRMDAISFISKTPAFEDGKVTDGLYGDLSPFCMHGPKIHEYLREMNQKVLSKYDILTVGEVSGSTVEDALKYAGEGRNELQMAFQFEHVDRKNGIYGKWTDEKIGLAELKNIFTKWQKELEGKGWNCLFWGNHDQPRAVSRFGDDSPEYREVSAKMLATCLYMMKGTPYIFQGEELGMTNAYFERLEDYRDIETIQCYDKLVNRQGLSPQKAMSFIKFTGRDNARTPMQWSGGKNGGFTNGIPWIKVNPNCTEINAESQLKNEKSVYQYYRRLFRLKHSERASIYGVYDLILPEDKKIYAYTRKLDGEILLVVCNFTKDDAAYRLPDELRIRAWIPLINNYDDYEPGKLQPYQAVVLKAGAE